jgi:hypothetical protein
MSQSEDVGPPVHMTGSAGYGHNWAVPKTLRSASALVAAGVPREDVEPATAHHGSGIGAVEHQAALEALLQAIEARGWPTWTGCTIRGDVAEVVFARGADLVAFLADGLFTTPVEVKAVVPGALGALIGFPAAVYLDVDSLGSIVVELRTSDPFAHVHGSSQRRRARRGRS